MRSFLTVIPRFAMRPSSSSRLLSQKSSASGMGYSFAGPKSLSQILVPEKCYKLSGPEISALWHEFHKGKPSTFGYVAPGPIGDAAVTRAKNDRCGFFLAPVFASSSPPPQPPSPSPAVAPHYNLLVQFYPPCHFVCTDLDAYKANPGNAPPLMSFSVFNDYSTKHGISLVRADVMAGLDAKDGEKVVRGVVGRYGAGDEATTKWVELFNHQSAKFDIDKYTEECRVEWFSS